MPELLSRLQSALSDRYRLEREIGAGGMATVYLAQDVRHDRQVALKVLRPELAAVIGAERFLAEIKLTANLQHPHILPALRLRRSRRLPVLRHAVRRGGDAARPAEPGEAAPVADAVRISTEVAAALDYAHRHGVVHRDIKPENILLHDGQALVADFGIALAASKASGARMTETGMSLGTPHYMSPEQAMGEREITARSDVYALGAVLYEMLTGDPPFTGSTAQAIVARVVTESPRPLIPQRHTIPPHVEAAVLTALEKLPADRFASAAEFAEALKDKSYRSTAVTVPVAVADGHADAGAHAGSGLCARRGAVAGDRDGALGLAPARTRAGGEPLQPLPAVQRGTPAERQRQHQRRHHRGREARGVRRTGRGWRADLAAGSRQAAARPHRRHRGRYQPLLLPRRAVDRLPRRRETVKVISLGGGPAITLSDSINSSGGDWGSDGYVYIEVDSGLARIRATGGPQEPVYRIAPGKKEIGTEFPDVLPGAKGLVFRLRHAGQAPADYDIMAMKLPGGEAHTLMHGLYARYAAPGQLLVVTGDGKLLAVPFDPDKLAFTGPPVAMLEGMRTGGFESNLATSAEGTMVYVSGGSAGLERAFWVGRDGAVSPVDSTWDPQAILNSVSLSPDGKQLAVGLVRGAAEDIWVKQLPVGTFSRVTFGDSIHNRVSWTADGRSVLYLVGSQSSGVPAVTRADGTGTPRILYRGPMGFGQAVASRDGRWLLLRRAVSEEGNGDIYALRPGDSTLTALLATPARETSPALSPDGKWLAYVSNESGKPEVYVRPFPDVGSAKWQVSLSGGFTPMWAHSGKELFYLDDTRNMVAVTVRPGTTFTVTGQKVLFPAASYSFAGGYPTYDVAPDDSRFVMIRSVAPSAETELVLVQNWAEELKARGQ